MVSTPDVAEQHRHRAPPGRRSGRATAPAGQRCRNTGPSWACTDTDKVAHAEQPGHGPIQDFMAAQAREHGIWLIGGTLPLASRRRRQGAQHDPGLRPAGRAGRPLRQDPPVRLHQGRANPTTRRAPSCRAQTSAASTRRSARSACRSATTCAFPELFRAMGDCALIVVPAAFTYTTGQRALGNAAARPRHRKPVLRAGRGPGRHPRQRPPHLGPQHADRPLGRDRQDVLAEGEGVVAARSTRHSWPSVRASLPALKHRKL